MATSFTNPLFDGPSFQNQETAMLRNDLIQQKKIGTGYFQLACGISILLFLAMAVILALTLNDLDKCEKKPSAHCPYFTKPNPSINTKSTADSYNKENKKGPGAFTTSFITPAGNELPLNPNPYAS